MHDTTVLTYDVPIEICIRKVKEKVHTVMLSLYRQTFHSLRLCARLSIDPGLTIACICICIFKQT